MNRTCPHCHAQWIVQEGEKESCCPHCGKPLTPPLASAEPPSSSGTPHVNICPICCTPIEPGAPCVICPDCKMVYHQDCWRENKGCATYGCPSAGCLEPPPLSILDSDLYAQSSDGSSHDGTCGTTCPYCHNRLSPGATFCWSCGHALSTSALPTALGDAPLSGPWPRWEARLLDMNLVMIPSMIIIGMLSHSEAFTSLMSFPIAFMLDSAVYSIFKNTLGKWLFDIHVLEASGEPISGKRYFYRNWRVYWGGYGLSIPIISLLTFYHQYKLVSKKQPATYDKTMNMKTVRCSPKPFTFKTLVGILLNCLMFPLISSLVYGTWNVGLLVGGTFLFSIVFLFIPLIDTLDKRYKK